jgi:hypothetical protein
VWNLLSDDCVRAGKTKIFSRIFINPGMRVPGVFLETGKPAKHIKTCKIKEQHGKPKGSDKQKEQMYGTETHLYNY